MNYNNGGGGGGAGDVMSTTEDNASEVGASVTSIAMKSNSGSGSTKAIKLSYSVEQCENELTDEYKEVLRTTSVTGKASIKHLLAGKSYRFRIVSINALGVAGPPSESIVVHTLIDTPPQPNLALISLPSGKYNNTSSHTSSSGNHGGTSNPAVLGVDKKASIEPYKIAITWKGILKYIIYIYICCCYMIVLYCYIFVCLFCFVCLYNEIILYICNI